MMYLAFYSSRLVFFNLMQDSILFFYHGCLLTDFYRLYARMLIFFLFLIQRGIFFIIQILK